MIQAIVSLIVQKFSNLTPQMLASQNSSFKLIRLQANTDGGAHSSAGHSSHYHQRSASSSGTQRGNNESAASGSGASNTVGQGGSTTATNNNTTHGHVSSAAGPQECPLCYNSDSTQGFYILLNCKHIACRTCLESYLTIEIFESRTEIACPECTDAMHPSDIQMLLRNFPTVMKKYEDFMVRRVLLCDPDTRWCPAPDCR